MQDVAIYIKVSLFDLSKVVKRLGEQDDKIIAIPYDGKIFPQNNLENLEDLKKNYPGVLKIIETWFYNYKRSGQVEIHGYDTKYKAIEIIKASQKPYETLRGYWLQNN